MKPHDGVRCIVFIIYYINASADEYRLLRDLRQNYDPLERPVPNSSLPLNDEKNQVVTLVAWIEYAWNDYKLRWDPSEYGNVKDIRIPGTANAIWKPDVLLYNSVDENFDSTFPVNYVVSYDGSVLQVPPGIMKLSCKIDITWFPFDDQMCHLKFGSWTYSGNFINLQIAKVNELDEPSMDTQYYVPNGEWNLLATPAYREETEFGNEPYCALFFFFIIQRRTLYYGLNLIIPSLLISLMTVLGFTLPPDAGEKITLEITILLSVCFFLSMVAEMTPPTSEAVPLIGAFFSCCMLVVSASVVFTVLVLNLHNRKPETHEMSPFVRKCLLHWLPWMLMMKRPGIVSFSMESVTAMEDDLNGSVSRGVVPSVKPTNSLFLLREFRSTFRPNGSEINYSSMKCKTPPLHTTEARGRNAVVSASPCERMHLINSAYSRDSIGKVMIQSVSKPHQPRKQSLQRKYSLKQQLSFSESPERCGTLSELYKGIQKACTELHDIALHMKAIRSRMEEEEKNAQAENDWRFAAMVVDRMCLFIFTCFIIVSTCAIMFSSPHLIA